MEFNKDLVVALIGYFLAIFFSGLGLIYGVILYLVKRDNEIYYEHSRIIIAIAILLIIIRIFASLVATIF